ncbi:MAG TPA: cyclic nucleotide-binding domain-containing protein [Myxococcaceae bacterium]|nr:cyclic nucleotide-binding domain-containing protein [Myxococcaceae bacterium]
MAHGTLAFLLEFVHGNASLVFGGFLALVLLGLRALSRDRAFRNDLRGAIILLFAFMALRSAHWLLGPYIAPTLRKLLSVGWKLSFSFGLIRASVSAVLWVFRLRARNTPRILRDVLDFSLYTLSAVPILKSELDIDVTGVVATSAVLSLVIGLALQDTLGNLFAGLSLQVERPFQVGDCVTVGAHTGKVTQVAWRATRIETFRGVSVTVPNSLLAKEPVQNYSRGYDPVGVDIHVGVAFDTPPNRVKAAVFKTLAEVPEVVAHPPPQCRFVKYESFSIDYRVRFYIFDFADAERLIDEIYSRLWYRLRREGVDVPFPQQIVTLRRHEQPQEVAQRRLEELLASVDLFATLSKAESAALAAQVVPRSFGTGERIVEAGQPGQTFYLVASGEVVVHVGNTEQELKRLGPGNYFGEMSLLTGEPRTATVTAAEDSVLLELNREVMARLFNSHPRFAKQVSALVAKRRNEMRSHGASRDRAEEESSEAGRILSRLKNIFSLKD